MNEKVGELLKKIKSSTKNRKISWGRVSDLFSSSEIDNKLLKQFILRQERGAYFYTLNSKMFSLNQFKSFYAVIQQGYVYVFKNVRQDSSYYTIAVQSNIHSTIVELNNKDELQPELIELSFLIEGQVDNPFEYIDSILEKL